VEAARAGEAGRGFSVVAEEVRALAHRAKEAARNTEGLIASSVQNARSGGVMSAEVSAKLKSIADLVAKVQAVVGEITVASQEQAAGIEQINRAVSEMDKSVQLVAANAEENSSVSQELSGQAQEVRSQVEGFHTSHSRARTSSLPRLGSGSRR